MVMLNMQPGTTTDSRTTTLNRWSLAAALLFAAYFLITAIYIGSHRLFWYDEVFTTLTIRLPDWHTIWRALTEDNADPSPIGFFVIERFFDRLFGPGEIGIRLPSALAMTAGMLISYDCVRRITDGLHGVIAMAVLSCSYLTYYGYEGRCYALFFLFASAVFWAWIGKRSPLLLGVLFLGGVLIHYFIVFCFIPFALNELWNWRTWRRPSSRMIGGILGAVIGLALLSPQILASRHVHGAGWWTPLNGRQVPAIYADFFPAGVFLLAMITLWVVFADRSEPLGVKPISSAERIGWLSLLIPIAGYIVARLVTHAFLNRYFIGILPGVAIAFPCLLWRRYPGRTLVPLGILVILAGYGMADQAAFVLHPEDVKAYGPAQLRTKAILSMEDELAKGGARYIVMDEWDLRLLEARYYSKHPERYVAWRDKKPPVSKYYPMQIWTLDDIKQHSREVVFIDMPTYRVDYLQQAGYRTTFRMRYPLVLISLD